MTRSQQIRRAAKRRRRAQRRQRAAARAESGRWDDATEWDLDLPTVTMLLPLNGQPLPERLPALPEGRLSDALVNLIEPYAPWPPAADELEELEGWLLLAAGAWNAAALDEAAREEVFDEVVANVKECSDLGDEEAELSRIVREIARRKRELYAHDPRTVSSVEVVEHGGHVAVYAAGAWTIRG